MSSDYSELLAAFNARGVEYIVVGAHALAAHGHVRATKDLDIWVRPSADNANRVLGALQDFGAPRFDLTAEDLQTPGVVFQLGVAPVRIDIITAIDGVEFEDAWSDRMSARFEDQEVAVLSRQKLIANKRAVGRAQDLADIEWLEQHLPD